MQRGCVRVKERRGVEGAGKEDVRGPTRGSVGSSMLHNLCRYILYVCRYIAQYISMANESNVKSGRKKWKDIVHRGPEGGGGE